MTSYSPLRVRPVNLTGDIDGALPLLVSRSSVLSGRQGTRRSLRRGDADGGRDIAKLTERFDPLADSLEVAVGALAFAGHGDGKNRRRGSAAFITGGEMPILSANLFAP